MLIFILTGLLSRTIDLSDYSVVLAARDHDREAMVDTERFNDDDGLR